MAIKLEVTNTGMGGGNNGAVSFDGSNGFGQQTAKITALPTEDVSGNVNAMMRNAQSKVEAGNSILATLDMAQKFFDQQAEAEDKIKAGELENQMIAKHAEVNQYNQERVLKGEITLAQVPFENKKALEEQYNAMIENTPFNRATTRDELRQVANKRVAFNHAQDLDSFTKQNTQNAIDAFNLRISSVAQSMTDPGAWARGVQSLEEIKQNDPLYRLNPAANDIKMEHFKRTQSDNIVTNLAKNDPNNFFRLENDGTLDQFKGYYSEEQWKGFINDAEKTMRVNENIARIETDRKSQEKWINMKLASEQAGSIIFTRSQIDNDPDLQPSEKVQAHELLDKRDAAEEAKYKDLNEIAQKQAEANGTNITLSNDELNKYYNYHAKTILDTFNKNDFNQNKIMIDNMAQVSGGRLPDIITRQLNTLPTEEGSQTWAKTVRYVQENYSSQAKGISDENKDIAIIMDTEGENNKKPSFSEARIIRNKRIEEYRTAKEFDDTGIDKNSVYKKPNDFVSGKLGNDYSATAVADFLKEYRYVKTTTPNLSDEKIAEKAWERTGWNKEEIGGKTFTMHNPPNKVYNQEDYKVFTTVVNKYIEDNNIQNFMLVPAAQDVGQYKSYMIFNWDKNKYEDLKFYPDKEAYDSIIGKQKATNNPVLDRILSPYKDIKAGIDQAQSEVKGLTDHPGLFKAIAGVESSYNPDAINPSSGAYGLYQFVKSTGKQYGLEKGGPVEDQHIAMTNYWNDLIKRYPGNIEGALKEYSGYYYNVDKYGKNYADNQFQLYIGGLKKYGYDLAKHQKG